MGSLQSPVVVDDGQQADDQDADSPIKRESRELRNRLIKNEEDHQKLQGQCQELIRKQEAMNYLEVSIEKYRRKNFFLRFFITHARACPSPARQLPLVKTYTLPFNRMNFVIYEQKVWSHLRRNLSALV